MTSGWEGLRERCEAVGKLEYIVESRRDGRLETWLVVRPREARAHECKALGLALTSGCRVVIDAQSMRPVGVLESDLPPVPPSAGYNPYFDLPAA